MASAWKCEFCHTSQVTQVGLAELKQELQLKFTIIQDNACCLFLVYILEEPNVNCNLQCTGPLLHYLNGEPIEADQAWKSIVQHVHEKCVEWYVSGNFHDTISE